MIGAIFELIVVILKLVLYDVIAIFRFFVPVAEKSVEGSVILVTGAGHGLGRLTALKLARKGAKMVLWDINEQGNEDTAEQIRQEGGEAHAYTVNVTDKERVKQAAKDVKKDVGTVNILVNNAGVFAGQSILDLTDDQIIRTMNVNTMAHFWTIRAFLNDMLEADDGHIVTIASVAAYAGSAYIVDYSAAKFAARGLDDALEWELKDVFKTSSIKLTCVCPFFVNTGLFEQFSSRFIPTLTEEPVAEAIVDGMLRNKRYVFLPSMMSFLIGLRAINTHDWYVAAARFLDVTIKPQKPRI